MRERMSLRLLLLLLLLMPSVELCEVFREDLACELTARWCRRDDVDLRTSGSSSFGRQTHDSSHPGIHWREETRG